MTCSIVFGQKNYTSSLTKFIIRLDKESSSYIKIFLKLKVGWMDYVTLIF